MNAEQKAIAGHLEFVDMIVKWLGEENAFYCIHLTVRVLGQKRVMELLKETLAVHTNGGMTTKDGARKRTIGGIFFFLVKQYHWQELPKSIKYIYRTKRSPKGEQQHVLSDSNGTERTDRKSRTEKTLRSGIPRTYHQKTTGPEQRRGQLHRRGNAGSKEIAKNTQAKAT